MYKTIYHTVRPVHNTCCCWRQASLHQGSRRLTQPFLLQETQKPSPTASAWAPPKHCKRLPHNPNATHLGLLLGLPVIERSPNEPLGGVHRIGGIGHSLQCDRWGRSWSTSGCIHHYNVCSSCGYTTAVRGTPYCAGKPAKPRCNELSLLYWYHGCTTEHPSLATEYPAAKHELHRAKQKLKHA